MTMLLIDAGETDHYAVHAVANEQTRPGSIEDLFRRFAEAAVPVVLAEPGSVEWCYCVQCTRLSLMASLRLAEHEHRIVVADHFRRILAGVRP